MYSESVELSPGLQASVYIAGCDVMVIIDRAGRTEYVSFKADKTLLVGKKHTRTNFYNATQNSVLLDVGTKQMLVGRIANILGHQSRVVATGSQ